jgi:hypothetical protein
MYLPWPLLGFLNVRKAVIVSNEFFKNHSADGGLAEVARLQIIDNPAPVLPRAFLAASADGVADAAEAAKKVFDGDRPRDVQERSFVEGLAAPAMYDAKGEVAVAGSGDRRNLTSPRLRETDCSWSMNCIFRDGAHSWTVTKRRCSPPMR